MRRLIAKLRDEFGAPVRFDRARGGWVYGSTHAAFDLPGLWFSAAELQAMLAAHQWLSQVEPGLLGSEIAPLAPRRAARRPARRPPA